MKFYNMLRLTFVFLLVTSMSDSGLTVETRRLSSRVVNTKYGSLRGFLAQLPGRTLPNVEVFLGVPYASPPLGSLRFMPPVTPSHWRGVRMADRFGAVCPQKLPDIRNETEALKRMPAGRLEYLKKLLPLLQNHSEDCLYLNIYVPARTSELSSNRLAVMVFIHGESYEWNSGNPYDGSILASYGNVVVVTVNYRLGIFGFLPALDQASRGNYGLMDQVAALHWVQENIAEFGGDPRNVTIVGHGPGAACVHLLMLSPMAKNLFQRGIMQSGSALSPWAIARSAKHYAKELAEALNCPTTDNNAYMNCMRDLLVSQLQSIRLTVPDHLTAFGPTIDGIVVPKDPVVLMEDEETQFVNYDLLFGVNKIEYYFGFAADEDKNGIDNDRRDRIMRTLVRNTHRYHMQEIFLTVVNEYTDWTKPLQHTLNIMESASEAIGDATIVAPIIRVGNYHATAPKKTYFYVFQHQTEAGYYPTRMGSLHGEELSYLFGVPLVLATSNSGGGGTPSTANRNAKMGLQPSKSGTEHMDSSCPLSSCHGHAQFALNYTKQESSLSEQFMNMWTSFAKTGDPAGPPQEGDANPVEDKTKGKSDRLVWPQYEGVHQKYLHINTKSKVKDHYNAHRLSFWLHLVPNLDQSRGISGDLQHHQLEDHENKSKYDGVVRTGTPGATDEGFLQGSSATTEINPALAASGGMAVATKVLGGNGTDGHFSSMDPMELPKPTSGGQEVTAPIGATNVTNSMAVVLPPNGYSTALSVTIAVGCSLLILNVLIFAGVYYQRDKKGEESQRKSPKVRYGQCSPCSALNAPNHDSDPNVFQQTQCTSQAESHFGTVHSNKHQFIRLPTSGSLTMTAPIHHHHHPHDNSPDFLHHESGIGLMPSVIGVLPPKVPPKPTNIGVSPQEHLHLTPEAQPLLAGAHQGDPNQLGVQVLPSNQQQHARNNQQQNANNASSQGTLGRGQSNRNNTTAQEMRILRAPLVQECVEQLEGIQPSSSPINFTANNSPLTSSPPLPPKSSSSSSTATTVVVEPVQESVSPGVDGPRFLRRAHNPRLWGDNRSSPPTVCAACDEENNASDSWANSLQRRARLVPLVPRQRSQDSAGSGSSKGPCVQKETTV